MSRCARRLLFAISFCASLLVASTASAQQYLIGASAQLASGVDGGGGTSSAFMRTRTRIRLGCDLRIDESPEDVFGAALLAQIEPRAAFGVDVRYFRAVSPKVTVNAGALGYLAPSSLFGPSAGLDMRFPAGAKTFVTLGPEVNFFVLGSDLPDGTFIWQALLQVGAHVDL